MQKSFRIKDILKIIEAEVFIGEDRLHREISSIFCSDLMSDILSYSKSDSLLITGLTNPQIIRTAEMVEIAAICFVHGKSPLLETIEGARNNEILLLGTKLSMYEASGKLYAAEYFGGNNLP